VDLKHIIANRFVEKGDYKQAAINIIVDHAQAAPARDAWKRWKKNYGMRADFPEITKALTLAFLQWYHTGGKLVRDAVAEIFGEGKTRSRLSVKRLIETVRCKKRTRWILPDEFTPGSPDPERKAPRASRSTRVPKSYRFPRFPIRRGAKVFIDLRRDARELTSLLATHVNAYAAMAKKSPLPPVSAVTVGFHLCQAGWVLIHLDVRERHVLDGHWTTAGEFTKTPHWKTGHRAAQANGGTFILPGGKTIHVTAGISCAKLAAIYGRMIKSVLLNAEKAGRFEKLPLRENFQLDVEEFDWLWTWPKP
jgi:hypothetical protein